MEANPNRRIVVGVDSSPEAAAALDWARRIAGPDDQIVAVRAWSVPYTATSQFMVAVFPDDFEQAAKASLSEILGGIDDARIVPVVREGRPGPVIVDVAAGADDRPADLVVVGHRGDSRMSLMLGSTANYVLHHADRPVVVVRGEVPAADQPLVKRIVIGVDDNDLYDGKNVVNESVRAVQWAYALPGVEHIRVINSWFLPPVAIGVYPSLGTDLEPMDEAARQAVDRVLEAAGPAPEGVTIERDAVRGAAGVALVEESAHADLVVVGSRGVGSLRGLLLGSTSAEVASRANSPVAVIR